MISLWNIPVSILYKSIAGRHRPVRVADGPITARYRFIKNASWDVVVNLIKALTALMGRLSLNAGRENGPEQ